MNDQSNHDSWANFAAGDANIWQEFLDRVIPRLYGMFVNRWANRSLAEELVQKTVFDAVRGRESFDTAKGSPEEWIFGIARNNLRLELRRRTNRPSVDGDIGKYLERIDSELLPDEILEKKETADLVRKALGRLESKQCSVLKDKYIEGLSAASIAERKGITEKAVHSLLYRARNSLRQELEKLVPRKG